MRRAAVLRWAFLSGGCYREADVDFLSIHLAVITTKWWWAVLLATHYREKGYQKQRRLLMLLLLLRCRHRRGASSAVIQAFPNDKSSKQIFFNNSSVSHASLRFPSLAQGPGHGCDHRR